MMPYYPQEVVDRAVELRRKGTPFKKIAKELGISSDTIYRWTQEIELTPEQHEANLRTAQRERSESWVGTSRARRELAQQEGRQRAHRREPLHIAGCMLYWAEGAKCRNTVVIANSDAGMLRIFKDFLAKSLGVTDEDITLRLNVYLGNGLSLEQIEDHWMEALGLPRSTFLKPTLNHFPTSSSGKKKNKLPYGVCTLRVKRSTYLVQHIFGAIQEYAGLEEPSWLDGPPRKEAVS